MDSGAGQAPWPDDGPSPLAQATPPRPSDVSPGVHLGPQGQFGPPQEQPVSAPGQFVPSQGLQSGAHGRFGPPDGYASDRHSPLPDLPDPFAPGAAHPEAVHPEAERPAAVVWPDPAGSDPAVRPAPGSAPGATPGPAPAPGPDPAGPVSGSPFSGSAVPGSPAPGGATPWPAAPVSNEPAQTPIPVQPPIPVQRTPHSHAAPPPAHPPTSLSVPPLPTVGTSRFNPYAGPPAAVTGSWRAPGETEQDLYEARTRGDWTAYLDVLARTDLYASEARGFADSYPAQPRLTPHFSRRTGSYVLAVHTSGMLPAPAEDPVYFRSELGWLARSFGPAGPPWMVVNPDSPCEGWFSTTPWHRGVWEQHVRRAVPDSGPRLRSLAVGAPLHGPLAHGLACGALQAVENGELWNAIAFHGGGYTHERVRLSRNWGLGHPQDWAAQLNRLLAGDTVSPVWEFVLDVRHHLARSYGGAVDADHWRQFAERTLREGTSATPGMHLSTHGTGLLRPRGASEIESQVSGVKRLIDRIARHEARFRADGALAEGKYVRSVRAWDWGTAASLARWGVGARWCTPQGAEHSVLTAGQQAQTVYRSWEDFAAGYMLGRCLHFDDEEFGERYRSMVTSLRILTSDPASPWLNLPWN